jgi:N6-L-threonylcarbamoyladenine synthase
MKILSIDTSCDDTCVAVLEVEGSQFKIISNIVSSQVKLHQKYGGVYPSLAKREHQKNLPAVFEKAIENIDFKKIDLIGVTAGPGLEPCLWQGINFANELARKTKKPLIPVNHIEAHLLSSFLNKDQVLEFPVLALVVSGGHTQLILMKKVGQYKLIGETRDDAAGECFDKTARILGLGYPGGPIIAEIAAKFNQKENSIKLPRPMLKDQNYDFSFSGLKTAVLYNHKNQPEKVKRSLEYIQEMCFEIQQSIIDVLIKKTIKAAKDFKVKTIILGGGVAANTELRKQFGERIKKETPNIKFYLPALQFCTDNAAMIGVAAYFNYLKNKKKKWREFSAQADLQI